MKIFLGVIDGIFLMLAGGFCFIQKFYLGFGFIFLSTLIRYIEAKRDKRLQKA